MISPILPADKHHTQVTVNLFTLYTMERVVGIQPVCHPWLLRHRRKAADYVIAREKKPAKKRWEVWKSDPGLALWLYAQLQHT